MWHLWTCTIYTLSPCSTCSHFMTTPPTERLHIILNVKIIVRVKSLDILCLKVHQTTFIYQKLWAPARLLVKQPHPALSVCEINGRHVTNGDGKLPSSDLLRPSWCHPWRSTAVVGRLGRAAHTHRLQHVWLTQQNVAQLFCQVVLCCHFGKHWWTQFIEQWVRDNATPSSKDTSDWAEGRMWLTCRTLMHSLPLCSGGEPVQGLGGHLANQWKWLELGYSQRKAL